jgi:hypothetical protein
LIQKYFLNEKYEIPVLLLHVALGILSLVSNYFFIAWFYVFLFGSLGGFINPKTRSRNILFVTGYFFTMELIGRMLKASPFIPYQVGTYFMVVVFTLAIFDNYKSAKTNVGFVILLLCIPGFLMISKDDYLTNFINALSGIFCLGLAAVYFARQRYTENDLLNFFKIILMPILLVLTYLFFRTPSFSEIEFDLKANFKTSGGFGSNQVSTILGAGACLLLLPLLKGKPLFKTSLILNLGLIAAFIFRGFLTFSRGGILGSLLVVLICYLYLSFTDNRRTGRNILQLIFFSVLAVIIFQVTDNITGGKLGQRYRGETGGTIEGTREKDLRVITSGRTEIIETEWNVFKDNMLLGVGPGNGYEARRAYVGKTVASHTEVTRLISEQGVPGMIIAVLFLFFPFLRISQSRSKSEKYYLAGIFLLAIVTSFHASMRTMITPLLWGVGCAGFIIPDRKILRNPTSRAFISAPESLMNAPA